MWARLLRLVWSTGFGTLALLEGHNEFRWDRIKRLSFRIQDVCTNLAMENGYGVGSDKVRSGLAVNFVQCLILTPTW